MTFRAPVAPTLPNPVDPAPPVEQRASIVPSIVETISAQYSLLFMAHYTSVWETGLPCKSVTCPAKLPSEARTWVVRTSRFASRQAARILYLAMSAYAFENVVRTLLV